MTSPNDLDATLLPPPPPPSSRAQTLGPTNSLQASQVVTEVHPKLNVQTCGATGCTTVSKSITVDSNWRWLESGGQNCFTVRLAKRDWLASSSLGFGHASKNTAKNIAKISHQKLSPPSFPPYFALLIHLLQGNTWDQTNCPSTEEGATSCAANCALEGATYEESYGIKTEDDQLSLAFVTVRGTLQCPHAPHDWSRCESVWGGRMLGGSINMRLR